MTHNRCHSQRSNTIPTKQNKHNVIQQRDETHLYAQSNTSKGCPIRSASSWMCRLAAYALGMDICFCKFQTYLAQTRLQAPDSTGKNPDCARFVKNPGPWSQRSTRERSLTRWRRTQFNFVGLYTRSIVSPSQIFSRVVRRRDLPRAVPFADRRRLVGLLSDIFSTENEPTAETKFFDTNT